MDEAEDRMLSLKCKVEELDNKSKYKKDTEKYKEFL